MAKRKRVPSQSFKQSISHLHLDDLKETERALHRQLSECKTKMADIHSKLDAIVSLRNDRKGNGDIGISDHAVVRYLERHIGMDIRKIRQEIRDRFGSKRPVENMEGFYHIGDGLIGIMPDGVIAATIVKNIDKPT